MMIEKNWIGKQPNPEGVSLFSDFFIRVDLYNPCSIQKVSGFRFQVSGFWFQVSGFSDI